MKKVVICLLLVPFTIGFSEKRVSSLQESSSKGLWLIFDIGIRDKANTNGVIFKVETIYEGEKRTVFMEDWTKCEWKHCAVDLTKFRGKSILLRFLTDAKGDACCDWACWGDPRIVIGEKPSGFLEGRVLSEDYKVIYEFCEMAGEVNAGIIISGKKEPIGKGAHFEVLPSTCGGKTEISYFAHPPGGEGFAGQTFGEFSITLPEDTSISRINSEEIVKNRIKNPVTIESKHLKFVLSRDSGSYYFLDKVTNEFWGSNPLKDGFCSAKISLEEGPKNVWLNRPTEVTKESSGGNESLLITYSLEKGLKVCFKISFLPGGKDVEISYSTAGENDKCHLESIDFSDFLWLLNSPPYGYMVVPLKEGILIPSKSNYPFLLQGFGEEKESYDWALSMAMLGFIKDQSTVTITWESDPYVKAQIRRRKPSLKVIEGRLAEVPALLSTSLTLRKSAKKVRLHFEEGSYPEMAKYYRKISKEQGHYLTFTEKLQQRPGLEKLFGAPAFRMACLIRIEEDSLLYTGKKGEGPQIEIYNTFEDVRWVAEHLKDTLKIDKALFILGGWNYRGYDNLHPDILPAAPECGGNEGLKKTSEAIRRLGYLFGFHDLYSLIFKKAPSFTFEAVKRSPDGSLPGLWTLPQGGGCYPTYAEAGLGFAKRNLPKVKELFNPNFYFIDTTTSEPLFEGQDSKGRFFNKQEDMHFKAELLRLTAETFGVSGTELGREWAIPYCDYFEGILSWYAEMNIPSESIDIPLFEMVYHNCVAPFSFQGDPTNTPQRLLDFLSMGRMPLFNVRLYFLDRWEEAPVNKEEIPLTYGGSFFASEERCGGIKKEVIFAHPAGDPVVGSTIGRYRVKLPLNEDLWLKFSIGRRDGASFVANLYDGISFAIKVNGEEVFSKFYYAGHRQPDFWQDYRINLGRFSGEKVKIEFITDAGPRDLANYDWAMWGEPRITSGEKVLLDFIREIDQAEKLVQPRVHPFVANEGWVKGLCPLDRLIKNSYEFLSPVSEITAPMEMIDHKFLTDDHLVEMSSFGKEEKEIVRVIVNRGKGIFEYQRIKLPPFGFLVDSPTFKAFHSLSYQDTEYSEPAFFTIRSLDNEPIEESSRIRVYHGFGEPLITLKTKYKTAEIDGEKGKIKDGRIKLSVEKEAVINFTD